MRRDSKLLLLRGSGAGSKHGTHGSQGEAGKWLSNSLVQVLFRGRGFAIAAAAAAAVAAPSSCSFFCKNNPSRSVEAVSCANCTHF